MQVCDFRLGACALVSHIVGSKLYVANAGDCECIVITKKVVDGKTEYSANRINDLHQVHESPVVCQSLFLSPRLCHKFGGILKFKGAMRGE